MRGGGGGGFGARHVDFLFQCTLSVHGNRMVAGESEIIL